MNNFKKSNLAKKFDRLKSENEALNNRIKMLEADNKRLTIECESLYEYFAEIQSLEDTYNSEIYKLKELKKRYLREVNSYIALKKDYKKAMEKFLDSLK